VDHDEVNITNLHIFAEPESETKSKSHVFSYDQISNTLQTVEMKTEWEQEEARALHKLTFFLFFPKGARDAKKWRITGTNQTSSI